MTRTALLDVAERCAWTAIQGFLGVFTLTDVSTINAALVAAAMGALSAIKSIAATKVSGTISPASMVEAR